MEKVFSKFFIASKKRYVGFDEMKKKITYTGMEAIRGDWTQVAKTFQMKIIEQIFEDTSKENIEKFILDFVKKLEKGEFDDMLEYHKKITKPLDQYVKMTPPHVKAARELDEFSGRLVKYVMLTTGPKHVSLVDKGKLGLQVDYDYKHYVEKQLRGVSDDILGSFGIDFDDIILKKNQKSLDRFF